MIRTQCLNPGRLPELLEFGISTCRSGFRKTILSCLENVCFDKSIKKGEVDVVVQWCNPLTLQPETVRLMGLQVSLSPTTERHNKGCLLE